MIGARIASFALLAALLVTAVPARADEPAAAGIVHVVLCWLKEPGNAAQRERMLAASAELRSIPGVLELDTGAVVPSERRIVDDSFDIGVAMKFAGMDTLNAYLEHPDHLQRVQETFQPLCARIQAFDFEYDR